MDNKDLLKIYIEWGIKSSEFLDKAILTLATSSIGFVIFTDIKITQKGESIFYIGVVLMLITFSLVLVKYLISINNLEKNILKLQGEDITEKDINKFEKYIRYIYISTVILGIIFLSISLLI